jgi:lysophospholipase L1-like esterase
LAIACAWLTPRATPQVAPQTTPAQTDLLAPKDADQLATRMVQLIESTAFAIPGLIRASDPLKQSAQVTVKEMRSSPGNPAFTWRFINEVKAFLALADSMPRPDPALPTGDQQFGELREDLQRMLRHFEAILQHQNQISVTRDADPNLLKRYAEANAKLPPSGTNQRVVFLGDSITDAWRLNEYFTGREFVNRGISGQNTGQMLARFRQDVLDLNPKAVLILAGTNDINQGIAPEQIQENLASMGDLAKAHGMRVAMASILPVSDYHKDVDPQYERTAGRPPATIQALNRWIESHCASEGFIYVNYSASLVDTSGQFRSDLSDDGLHPNPKGYRVMSPVALDAIGRALAQPEETPPKRRFRIMGK